MKRKEKTLILVADDDLINRRVLTALLHKEGYDVVSSNDGREAVAACIEHNPDLVLLDVMMPVMDGYEAAREIKAMQGTGFVPIIFLTAMTDEESLGKCIEAGGDDFLTKPYNRQILRSKIASMLRIRELYCSVVQKNKELALYQDATVKELEIAKHVFENITLQTPAADSGITVWSSPMTLFNGDLLMSAKRKGGGIYVMLCDFTGHGLPAAVGALPAADVFKAMTSKNLPISDIVSELNEKLTKLLPTGLFCSMALLEINAQRNTLTVCNAGLPEIFVVNSDGARVATIGSQNIPVGVSNGAGLHWHLDILPVDPKWEVLMYTDGLIEAVGETGQMYGSDRLESCLLRHAETDDLFELIKEDVQSFRGDVEQNDDISLIRIHCGQAARIGRDEPARRAALAPGKNRCTTINMNANLIRAADPAAISEEILQQVGVPEQERGKICTVMMELYSNALEHGLLGLGAELKSDPAGFAQYYVERGKALERLEKEWIKIVVSLTARDDAAMVDIEVHDSGDGFDYHAVLSGETDSSRFCGRGLSLVRGFCGDITYEGNGNVAKARYHLG
ncbi:MAG TPA: response regulator [Gammaproteobacteria bacterium]|nr:response regulator [Gammaproteobacteria bacterium]